MDLARDRLRAQTLPKPLASAATVVERFGRFGTPIRLDLVGAPR